MSDTLKKWLKCAGIRALHTIGQTAIATIGTTAKYMNEVDWKMVLSASLLAGIISILKSMAMGIPEADMEVQDDETDDII